jgi:ubiquinol-cytochrome c reductase cytochrome b subunit/menaquinol-cytochrome c reductase cytochrome b/c subunit
LNTTERATFDAGAVVVGESGCLACHTIGENGNNGPGPPLTHIGTVLRPGQIASTLRNPTAPMPSFEGLAKAHPAEFQNLVEFLSMLQ